MSESVCLFTVVYPGCEPYLGRFVQAVEEQDYKEFELLVLNDGLQNFDHFAKKTKIPVHTVSVSGSIAAVREKGITMLAESQFDKIIFADADDYPAQNRIEIAIGKLEQCDVYVNDLTTVDKYEQILTKNYFSHRLGSRFEITSDFILQKNIIGLGNTSVRKTALRKIKIPHDTIAVDWLLFTEMLHRGQKAIFTNDTTTFYRQHEENTAGFKKLSPERLEHSLKVQLQNASYFRKESKNHLKWHKKLVKLQSTITQNGYIKDDYINNLELMLPQYPLWWEEIKYLNEIIQNS